jgi:hypothetical protein
MMVEWILRLLYRFQGAKQKVKQKACLKCRPSIRLDIILSKRQERKGGYLGKVKISSKQACNLFSLTPSRLNDRENQGKFRGYVVFVLGMKRAKGPKICVCWQLKVNLKEQIYLKANSTTQRCPFSKRNNENFSD